jgi:hypothetical protein
MKIPSCTRTLLRPVRPIGSCRIGYSVTDRSDRLRQLVRPVGLGWRQFWWSNTHQRCRRGVCMLEMCVCGGGGATGKKQTARKKWTQATFSLRHAAFVPGRRSPPAPLHNCIASLSLSVYVVGDLTTGQLRPGRPAQCTVPKQTTPFCKSTLPSVTSIAPPNGTHSIYHCPMHVINIIGRRSLARGITRTHVRPSPWWIENSR